MRRLPLVMVLVASVPLAGAQQHDERDFQGLVKRLGSADFRQRDSATEALKMDPNSATLLRDALRSPNTEIARRAAIILEYHDRRPVRDLQSAAKEGRVNAFVELLADWPAGKYETEAWNGVRDLMRPILELHEKTGGEKIDVSSLRDGRVIAVVSEPLVKEIRNNKLGDGGRLVYFFVRTRSVSLSPPPRSNDTGYRPGGVFTASGSVKLRSSPESLFIILAGGSVEIGGDQLFQSVVISGGDVTISSHSVVDSLVIARGQVTYTGARLGAGCRIISGKSVICDKKNAARCMITENDPNPLGFIRWTDPPKEKAKSK
jgi:hypothetical protein